MGGLSVAPNKPAHQTGEDFIRKVLTVTSATNNVDATALQ